MKPSARKHAKAQGGKSLAAAPTHGRRAARHAFARERSAALERALAILEWAADGILLDVNSEGCRLLGRSAEDLIGRRHDVFIKPESRESAEYRALREKLGRGEPVRWQYGLMTGAGGEVWVESFCTPIMDRSGTLARVIEHVIDITAHKLELAHQHARLAAIDKVQAVIEFALDGTILDANENFLKTVGYRLDEIKGRHHSLFVDRATRDSAEYRLFWEKLGRGEYDQGQYRRIGKDGREVWIQASYNPIFDLGGKPYKVIKYATDITEQVRAARQLQAAVEQTQAVVAAASQGDLSQRIPLEGKEGSIAEMCSGINAIIEAMATVVRQIQQAAASVRAAAQEIASGNADLSARTEQQAASLEETASSMEELTSTVKQNADNARQANQLAIGASEVARKGGRVVSDVVATMSAISEASKKIVDIIGVIDGIAFQTNILALNAAVEAARAGEQGRGFAVVAAEVRSLAQRSAAAAKEIKALIGDSVEKVSAGTRLVEQAGSTMEDIVTSVKRVTDIMAEISAASQEQSQGIEQVNQAITSMDEVTQQNAALVEEASAAARALQEQAEALADSVSAYVLEAGVQAPAPAPRSTHAMRPAGTAAPKPASRRPVAPSVRSNGNAAREGAASTAGQDQWTEF